MTLTYYLFVDFSDKSLVDIGSIDSTQFVAEGFELGADTGDEVWWPGLFHDDLFSIVPHEFLFEVGYFSLVIGLTLDESIFQLFTFNIK